MRPRRHADEPRNTAGRQREKVVATLRAAKPVPQRMLARGVIAYAQVPFADGTGWKSRPVVVVGVRGREVAVRPITTARRWKVAPNPAYVAIDEWEEAGLSRPSAVAPRTVTLDRMAVTGIVGRLSEADRAAVLNGTGLVAS